MKNSALITELIPILENKQKFILDELKRTKSPLLPYAREAFITEWAIRELYEGRPISAEAIETLKKQENYT